MTRRWRTLVGMLGAAAVVLPLLATVTLPASADVVLPPGFVLRDTPTGQAPYKLTDFAYLPDGSVITTGKDGTVTWVSGTGAVRTIAQLPAEDVKDLGLVGVAVAADYAQTGHVYLARAIPDADPDTFRARLSRFTVQGGAEPTGLSSETTILELLGYRPVHGMSGIVVDADGSLWVSIGDTASAATVDVRALEARRLDKPAGKLLHITPTGVGVPSNPYYDAAKPSSWRSRVYASGFRSPFRFSLDPATGAPIVGDVGWRTWEEVDVVAPGQDYKWPCWEGFHRTPGYRDLPGCDNVVNTPPVWEYSHGSGSGQGNSVTGGIVYTGSSYPEEYQGSYFFGDYVTTKIWTMRIGASGTLLRAPEEPPFATGIGGPVKFAAAPNGDVVYADILSGNLRRLSYVDGNAPPVAHASATTDPATRTVTFDGGESMDFDGHRLEYSWDFGDGTPEEAGVTVVHQYAEAAGEKLVATLTVTDELGATDSVDVAVAPSNHSPQLALVTPPAEETFAVDETVTVAASATDQEDGPLQVSWEVVLLHCDEESTCHAHPESAPPGPSFATVFGDHPNSRLQIRATATDSVGVSASETYVAMPREHLLRLTSNVPARMEIPGEATGGSAMVTEGAVVGVNAAAVASDGVSTFDGWDDGSRDRARQIVMGASERTLNATYLSPIGRRYARSAALREVLGAPTSPEVAEGGLRYREYEHGRLYWSATTGVHEVRRAIRAKFLARGGHAFFGVPTTDRRTARDGVGHYNHFARRKASVYWKPRTGAHAVWGAPAQRWRRLGAEAGRLGYPVTDVRATRNRNGRFVHFSKKASIYWSRRTGAREIYGPIRRRWIRLGRASSYLGFPTSGVREVRVGLRSNFQRGFIRWNSRTGRVVDRRY